jgi:hypothetical protein
MSARSWTPSPIQMMGGHVDIFQVGARNKQNYHLLRAPGEVRKRVLLKNQHRYENPALGRGRRQSAEGVTNVRPEPGLARR